MTYVKENKVLTEEPNIGQFSRWATEEQNISVTKDFDPNIDEYTSYLEKNNLEESDYVELLKEFRATKIDFKDIKYEEFLQYLIDNKKIHGNRKLYSHLAETLEYLVYNNLLHIEKSNRYKKILNAVLYSTNTSHTKTNFENKHKKIDYSTYEENDDFREVYNNQLLNELHNKGGEIYFNNNNKFYIKLRKEDELIERPKRTAENILGRVFGFKVQITDEVLSYEDINMDDFIFKSSSFEVIDAKLIGDGNE